MNNGTPLSQGQQALWLVYQEDPHSAAYNLALPLRFQQRLDHDILRRALDFLRERHRALRTVFVECDGIPKQVPAETADLLRTVDLGSLPESVLLERVRLAAHQPFDLKHSAFRATLFETADASSLLLLDFHHIVGDAGSLSILGEELLLGYAAFLQGQPPELPPAADPADFVAWENALLAGRKGERMEAYWAKQLGDGVPVLQLPTDHPRPPLQTYAGASVPFRLSAELTEHLKTLARQHNTRLFNVLLTAYQVLLHRYTAQPNIWIGVPTSVPRNEKQFAGLVGYLVNMMVVTAHFPEDGDLGFSQLLAKTTHTVFTGLFHQPYPFARLVQTLQARRDRSYAPLVQAGFSYENESLMQDSFAAAGLRAELLDMPQMEGQLDLSLAITGDNPLRGLFLYNTDLFDQDSIERLSGHFSALLEAIVANPQQAVGRLALLADRDIRQLGAWNDTRQDYPRQQTLVGLFEEQARQSPEAVALVFDGEAWTYRQINQQANRLAHYLLGLKTESGEPLMAADTLVGVCVERCPEMLVSLLAILKAGAAYLPLDPDYPAERIRYMLEHSAAPLVLTQSRCWQRGIPPSRSDRRWALCLDKLEATLAQYPDGNPYPQAKPDALAYVIYTSGSTGKPKGVMVEHRALLNFLLDMRQRIGFTATDALLAVTTLSFDIAGLELFLPLLAGGCIHLARQDTVADGRLLKAYLDSHPISFMQATPATWKLLQYSQWRQTTPLTVLCGGEAMPLELARYLAQNSRQLWNVYGPTETTIWSTAGLIEAGFLDKPPAIGKPITNTQIHILSRHLQLLPPGIPGELCIAGDGLARGYLYRPDLTMERFVNVELSEQCERVYRTGDLARWLPDGRLEYLGRIDHQVKLRGFRIELGEIESVLAKQPGVREVVAILAIKDGNSRLLAYVTGEQGVRVDSLKLALKTELPDYMQPSAIVLLDMLPLTPNGKIDRNALPVPAAESSVMYMAPATSREKILAGLWALLLQKERVGRQDDFFALGGHSLLAAQLTSRIRDSFQVELPIRAIFEHPLLEDLAVHIEESGACFGLPPILPQLADTTPRLSFAQQRLWFIDRFEGPSATYNIPVALQWDGPLDLNALQAALRWLVERHHSLRSRFPDQGGEPWLALLPSEGFASAVCDLSSLSAERQQAEIHAYALWIFDLAAGPLFRADLFLLAENRHALLLNMHHSISDGWSLGVLMRDFQQAYQAFCLGQPPAVPDLPVQYSDYAAWQREWLQGGILQRQVDYWRQQLTGAPGLLELPTDFPRPARQAFHGSQYRQALDGDLTRAVHALGRGQGSSLFMTLLAAFTVLLARYSRQDDLCIGSPIANRSHSHSHTEELVGFFVNTLVLRSRLQPGETFSQLLQAMRKTCLDAYAHQDIPFETLVEQLQPARSLSHTPLFQVMFALQNAQAAQFELPAVRLAELPLEFPVAKFDLTLNIEERDGQLVCHWEYATGLFSETTIVRMAAHFAQLLNAVTDNPDRAIDRLPMLTPLDIQQLHAWNDTGLDYGGEQTVTGLLELQAEQAPDNIALVFAGQSLSYRELNAQANRLANYLIQLTGTDGQTLLCGNPLVGICLERSPCMVVGLLAILKAGGAYLPIDPDYPEERIRWMLADSATPLLLTQSNLQTRLPLGGLEPACTLLCLDQWQPAGQSSANPPRQSQAGDLAYLIYTSGSTGRPKGVMLEHRGAVNLARSQREFFRTGKGCRVLQFASLSFDAATAEVLVALISGAALHLAPLRQIQTELFALLKEQAITHVTLPPSALAALPTGDLPALGTLIVAGEACPPALAAQWGRGRRFINAYGPTETTVCASLFECQADGSPTLIGRPIANSRIYILNGHHQPLPPGVPGELCVAGVGLARGYWNRQDLNAEKFIELELFGRVERVYKTGDLARWRTDGNLEFMGRIDQQVKLRGFRIELGEIEAVLAAHEAVREAVAVLYQGDGNPRLVAYVVLSDPSSVVIEQWSVVGGKPTERDVQPSPSSIATSHRSLTTFLKDRLPGYMVPAHIQVLESLPLTPNGKIDRKALPKPDVASTRYEPPCDTTEQHLAEIWQQVLKRDSVGMNDNFFGLGGHSLLLMQVHNHLQPDYPALKVIDLFGYPTIRALAGHLRQQGQPASAEPAMDRQAAQSRAEQRRAHQGSALQRRR